ncbi:LysM peptidoglycan-binding domain-containing protein [Rhizobium sp. DKSPLA3]|uniref:LysM peptidoglycan-binding domain-containing protein n=1 Tax=Rhizobium quercicola TaxID=2901226 RepID=A0A9X1NPX2_9HYPH|nr:LysM peptidoglycan-binding domain-containing protein [Rhizobium quercicola]MCD7108992.1 LysM peptidoglycan-binding domain-containing protein [Rhizobium quercicola]
MRKNTAGLVALVVLAIATLLMIFVVLPNVGDETPPTRAQGTGAESPSADVDGTPGNGDTTTADAKGSRPGAGDAANPAGATTPATPATPSAQPNSDPAKTAQPAPTDGAAAPSSAPTPAAPSETADGTDTPSFDVLRVEPDGSTVIAGRAEPNSKLEIVNGNAVVGTADVGGTGDFAAVFDKPLPPGDYQLTLRSTTPSGAVTASDEVATVSIPKVDNGQLLAMVTKPGEASRILTAPSEPAAPAAAAPAVPSGATPTTGDQAALQTPAATPSAPAPAQGTPAQSAPAQGTPASPVAVSAVEIEGRKLFVAGTARPGSTVRIYADDQLVGEGKADAQGRFVIDGELGLSVGQHVIRVDMVGADGKVQMRAAVPFERPEGDQISAVAQTPASGSDPAFDGAIFDASRMEAAKAFALLKGLYASGKLPGLDQLAAARSATEIALTSLAGVKPVAGMQAGVTDRVNATTKAAGEALAILKPLPRDAAAVGAALGRLDAAMARVLETSPAVVANSPTATPSPAPAGQTTAPGQSSSGQSSSGEPTTGAPAANTNAGTPSTEPGATPSEPAVAASPQTAGGEPETVQQAPLQQSKSSVIIRRGDTLWQISRRVYGAGVRYTTIYVANEDQILDPDRILPGQVFGVPDKALPDAESQEIHRRHMQHAP